MTTSEVVTILGRPTDIKRADIPGTYWSYDQSDLLGRSFPLIFFEVSQDHRVVDVLIQSHLYCDHDL